MVLTYPVPDDFAVVDVIGWGYAVEVWDKGEPAHYDPSGGTRLVRRELLYSL